MPALGIEETFHGSVTVGERGQVVIPASVREKMGVTAGEKLLVFAHPMGEGVLFVKVNAIKRMAEGLWPIIEAAGSATEDGVTVPSSERDS